MDLLLNGIAVRRDRPVLDLTGRILRFRPGTLTLVLGPCGAGKSTLLLAASGLLEPAAGKVELSAAAKVAPANGDRSGASPGAYGMHRLAAGYLAAHPEEQLFADTVRNELAYSLGGIGGKSERGLRERQIREVLREAGLPSDDAFLRKSPFSLSGGQKRRLALAGALLKRPDWLFLDEPTSGLDPAGKEKLRAALSRFRSSGGGGGGKGSGGGILVASHEADLFLPMADRVLLLRQGKLLYDGSPEDLWSEPQLLAEAGLALPERLKLACGLAEAGFTQPGLGETEEETAERLVQELLQPSSPPDRAALVLPRLLPNPAFSAGEEEPAGRTGGDSEAQLVARPARMPLLQRFDPRAQWLFVTAVSLGVWLQHGWTGAAVGLVCTLTVVRMFGVPLATLLRTSRYYAWLMAATALVAGLTWKGGGSSFGSVGFSLAEAGDSLRRLFQLYLVLWLGLLFPLSMSQLQLKKAIRQLLRPFSRLGMAVEAVSLGIMLIFRYVALIGGLWSKYAMLARIRRAGRDGGKRVKLKDIPPLLLPFFLSILQLGEQTAFALEERGYRGDAARGPADSGPKLAGRDWVLILVGILAASILIVSVR